MWKCQVLCVLVLLLKDVHGDFRDQMTEVIQRCCNDGSAFARSHTELECSSSHPVPNNVPATFGSLCTMARAQCCKEYFQKKIVCDAGIQVEQSTGQCGSVTETSKACCDECARGTSIGRANGSNACIERTYAETAEKLLSEDAYVQCCLRAAKEVSPPAAPNPSTMARKEKREGGILASVCEDYAPNELCAHHCIPVPGSYKCECNPGFMLMADGKNCKEVVKNRCKPKNPCQHKCNDNGVDVKCSCRRGFVLMPDGKSCRDIDECQLDIPVCLSGTKCHNIQGSYRCIPTKSKKTPEKGQCPPGFARNINNNACDDINECKLPQPPCPSYICENTVGGYKCGGVSGDPVNLNSSPRPVVDDSCPPGFALGYHGDCEDVDECATSNDDCNSLSQFCINTHSSFFCQDKVSKLCRPGFKIDPRTGKCEDIDECQEENDLCRPDETCINQLGQYNCKAKISETRLKNHQCPEGMRINPTTLQCQDIDECVEGTHLCDQHQTCLNTNGSYVCHCKLGYELDAFTGACVDLNECATGQHDCISGSQRCDNTVGSFLCIRIASCGTGYILQHSTGNCEDVDECALGIHNCMRAGPEFQCLNIPGSFRCVRKRTSSTTTTTALPEYDYVYYDSEEESEGNKTAPDSASPNPVVIPFQEPSYTSSTTTRPREEPKIEDNSILSETERGDNKPEAPRSEVTEPTTTVKSELGYNPEEPSYIPVEPRHYKEESEYKPVEPHYIPEEPRFTPEQPKYIPEEPRFTPEEPKYTPEEPKYTSEEPRHNQDESDYKPEEPKYTQEEPRHNQDESEYKPEEPKYTQEEPGHSQYESEYKPEEPSYIPEEPRFTPEEPKYTPEEPRYPFTSPVIAEERPTERPEPPREPETTYSETKPEIVYEEPSEPPQRKDTPDSTYYKTNNEPETPISNEIMPENTEKPTEKVTEAEPTIVLETQPTIVRLDPRPTYSPYKPILDPENTRPNEVHLRVGEESATVHGNKQEDGSVVVDTMEVPKNKWSSTDVKSSPCPPGFEANDYGGCFDIDECITNRHSCSGLTESCRNTIGGYLCDCAVGFRRDHITGACYIYTPISSTTPLPPVYRPELVPSITPVVTTEASTTVTTTMPVPTTVSSTTTAKPTTPRSRSFWGYKDDRFAATRPFYARFWCDAGYQQNPKTRRCEDVDECTNGQANCASVEICVNTEGGYRCECPPDWRLDEIRHRCVPALHYGRFPTGYGNEPSNTTQVVQQVTFTHEELDPEITQIEDRGSVLKCPWGYQLGDDHNCIDVDECVTGEAKCGPTQICTNLPGGYVCSCPQGFKLSRDHECEDVDECASAGNVSICSHNADCVNTIGSYQCNCHNGFRSAPVNDKVCVDVDECSEARAGSLCQHRCSNVWGSYRCFCHRGYRLSADNRTCSDVDECVQFKSKIPCVGTCLNEPGSYRCACPSGYRLSDDKRSCIDIDECETGEASCQNGMFGGTSHVCFNTRGSYRCQRITCPPGYQLESKHRCSKTQRVCSPGDWDCAHQPTTISYNFITFVSNLFVPESNVKLFTMRGPTWPHAKMKFELRLVNVNTPPSVKNRADINAFLLIQNDNEAVMSLVRPLEGPQSIELELFMELYSRDQFGGIAVAKLVIFVSEYEF